MQDSGTEDVKIPSMKAPASISARIESLSQTEDWPVSRSPVNEALQLLEDKGVLLRERNRTYFLAKATAPASPFAINLAARRRPHHHVHTC
jgi:hypothetical protein